MAGARTFVVRFLADAEQYKKGIKQVNDGMGGLKTEVSSLLPSFKTMAIAGAAAFGAVSAFAFKAVQAAAEDEKSQASLAAQLKRTFGEQQGLTDAVERYISVTQLRTGTSDVELRDSIGTLIRSTGNLKTAQNLLTVAQDVSAATGKDLASVSLALAKASMGQFTALGKLGIPLDESTKKSKDFGAVLATLQDQFGGAADAAANTFGGKLEIIKGQFGEIVETIGAALLPYLDRFATFLVNNVAPAVQRITSVISEDGLIAGFQQLIFESGGAGTAVVGVLRNIAIAAAEAANILYKLAYFAKAAIEPNYLEKVKSIAKGFTGQAIDVDKLRASFDKIASPVNRFKTELITADQAERNFNKTGKTTIETLPGVAKAVKEAGWRLKEYTDGLNANNAARKSFNNAQKDSIRASESLTEANLNLADAQNKFNQAVAGFGADSSQARKAAYDLAASERDLERANYGVEKSIRDVQDAEKNLAAVRAKKGADPRDIREAEIGVARAKQDQAKSIHGIADAEKELQKVRRRRRSSPEDLFKAETDLTNAKFNVEEAVFAVADAEGKLSDLRLMKGATPEEIRDAEIGLAEAKLSVADASDAQTDATDALTKKQDLLNEAISGALTDSETYKTLSDELKDAKLRQRDATDGVTDAIERESDALVRYTEAYAHAVALTLKFPKIAANNPLGGFAGTIPQTVTGNAGMSFVSPDGLGGGGMVINVNAGLITDKDTLALDISDLLTEFARKNGGSTMRGIGF